MLLGPVSGATPGLGNPLVNFAAGGFAIWAACCDYFRSKRSKKGPRQIHGFWCSSEQFSSPSVFLVYWGDV